MPPRVVRSSKLMPAFQENARSLERLGWKNLDSQQFSQAQLPLLKSLAREGGLTKSSLKAGVAQAKLSMSSAEQDLLVEKIKNCFSWCRKRLRDAGSGVNLPSSVKAVARLLCKGKGDSSARTSGKKKKTKKLNITGTGEQLEKKLEGGLWATCKEGGDACRCTQLTRINGRSSFFICCYGGSWFLGPPSRLSQHKGMLKCNGLSHDICGYCLGS